MLSLIIWKARGVANDSTVAYLNMLVRKYRLDILALLEPMVDFSKAQSLEHKQFIQMKIWGGKYGSYVVLLWR